MQILEINAQNIEKAVEYLRSGGVIIHPTDTCYGLAADITNPEAVAQVAKLKKMSLEKPISVLVADFEMLRKYAVLDGKAEEIARKYLPGSLTLLLPKRKEMPAFYANGNTFVGVRYPNHNLALTLAKKMGRPITTTSANITGEIQAYKTAEVIQYFGDAEVLFLNGGDLEFKSPSTILKCVEGSCEIVRQGDLLIENFVENVI